MPQSEFDVIIDDCFLDAAAKYMTRKYQDKVIQKGAKLDFRKVAQTTSNLKAA